MVRGSACGFKALRLEDAALGLRVKGTRSESVEQSTDECVGSDRIDGSHVQSERLQRPLVGHVHLDVDPGQGDMNPLGISCVGPGREFSYRF